MRLRLVIISAIIAVAVATIAVMSMKAGKAGLPMVSEFRWARGSFHSGQEIATPTKAGYIRADQFCHPHFSLAKRRRTIHSGLATNRPESQKTASLSPTI